MNLEARAASETTKEHGMKTSRWIHSAITALTLAMSACNRNSVDTALFEKTFKSAEATVQTSAEKVLAAIKAGDHPGALAELKVLAKNVKLSTEQQQVIKDMITQVEKLIADAATRASEAVGKAVPEVPKTLPS